MIKRRINLKITSTTRETIRLAGRTLRVYCAACAREVEVVGEDEAARILQVDDLVLGRLMDAGRMHAVPTISGSHLICKDSLFVTNRDDSPKQ